MPSLPTPGDRLAGFSIERELGHGTTGIVYLARQRGLDRLVALKVVGRPLAEDPAFRERFRREARAAAGLDHPNVVQVLESGEDDDHLWLAMRLVDGPDLGVLLRRTGRLEPEQAVAIVEQVAAALDAAHAAGLVHRDVKPGNLLIEDGPGRDLHVELADFGLARAPGIDAAEGTPGYAAPEQLAGEEAGPAADVFALGCVLYELLTGTAPPVPPVPSDAATPWRQGAAARTGPDGDASAGAADGRAERTDLPLAPSVALPRLGAAFDPAVQRATSPDPAQRFASAGELAVWARAALSIPRAEAAPEPPDPVRAAAATPASPDEVAMAAPTWEIPPGRSRGRRGRKLLVAVFLAAVLALLGAAFVAIGNSDDDGTGRLAGTSGTGPTPPGGAQTGAGGGTGSSGSGGSGNAAGSGTAAGGAGAPGAGTSSGGSASTGRSGPSGAGASGGSPGGGGTPGPGPSGGGGARGTGGAATAGAGSAGAAPGSGSSASGAATGRGSAAPGSSSVAGSGSAGGTGGSGPSGAAAGGSATPGTRRGIPVGSRTAPLPPIPAGHVRFGGGGWVLDLPAAEGWRQTAVQELDDGTRVLTRLARPDKVRLVVEAVPGRTAVAGVTGGRPFPVRLPEAGRTDGVLFRGGRFAMCATGICAALPANGPSGGVLVVASARKAVGTKRVVRRAASGLRVR